MKSPSKPPRKRLKARQRRLERIARQMERLHAWARHNGRLATATDIEALLHISNSAARRFAGRLRNEKI